MRAKRFPCVLMCTSQCKYIILTYEVPILRCNINQLVGKWFLLVSAILYPLSNMLCFFKGKSEPGSPLIIITEVLFTFGNFPSDQVSI